jgi:heme/copper-type cytochrome/quinol oxidase subunit 2
MFVAVVSILLSVLEVGEQGFSRITPSGSGSRKLEFVSLVIPVSGVLVINQLVVFDSSVEIYEAADVVGLQWYWAISCVDVALVNECTIGALVTVVTSDILAISAAAIFIISAVDVIHAVALPGLGVKADAIPGRVVQCRIESPCSGLIFGQCSELCGPLHGYMPLSFLVVRKLFWHCEKFLVNPVNENLYEILREQCTFLGMSTT